MANKISPRHRIIATGGVGLALSFSLLFAAGASADTVIDGPVNLGTAESYGVLGAETVTNTGPTVVTGDVGVSPGSSITGFDGEPGGEIRGGERRDTSDSAQAQIDTTTAYNVAASLTPTGAGMNELNGLSLTPGVYSGGALNLSENGELTLAGSAESVWVFQAASTLTIGSATEIVITGGASACNVFWQVGSSATLGTGSDFQGTVLADRSITANTGATIEGRLLARTGAVTLDTNVITAPRDCPPAGTPVETTAPAITSDELPDGAVGTPYEFEITATGSPSPIFTVSTGTLPAGLSLDATTGMITGTPTSPGETSFTVTASNGTTPDASVDYVLTVTPTDASSVPTPEAPAPDQAPTPPQTVETGR